VVLIFFHLLRPSKLLGFVLGVATVIGPVEASDHGIVVHETKELDILVLDDKELDTMESEPGPQV